MNRHIKIEKLSIRSPLRETSQRPLRNISKELFCDDFKATQIHLKKDVLCVISLRRLQHISKKMSIP